MWHGPTVVDRLLAGQVVSLLMANLLNRPRMPRPVRYQVQLVFLVDEAMGERMSRLVKATGLSMAEIGRQALADALPGLESYYHTELDVLDGKPRPSRRKRSSKATSTPDQAA